MIGHFKDYYTSTTYKHLNSIRFSNFAYPEALHFGFESCIPNIKIWIKRVNGVMFDPKEKHYYVFADTPIEEVGQLMGGN